jgi:hypothetical protein
MSETSLLWLDHVLPEVPYRQWVLSFEGRLGVRLGYDGKLLDRLCETVAKRLMQSLRRRVKKRHGLSTMKGLCPGVIVVVQRFRSDMGLYVHLHILATDGAYLEDEGRVRFLEVGAPDDREMGKLCKRLHKDLAPFIEDGDDALDVDEAVAACVQLSLAGPGPVAMETSKPELPAHCVTGYGMRLHAATAVDGRDRKRLGRLVKYMMRPPFAQESVTELSDGRVRLVMKKPNRQGATSVVMSPERFLSKLVALVPPPRQHQVRYYGVFAGRHRLRKKIVPRTVEPGVAVQMPLFADVAGLRAFGEGEDEPWEKRPARIGWAKLLARVFAVDVTKCRRCGGRMKVVEAVTDVDRISELLQGARPPPVPSPVGQLRLFE